MKAFSSRCSSQRAANIASTSSSGSRAFGSYMHALQRHVQQSSQRYLGRSNIPGGKNCRKSLSCHACFDGQDAHHTKQQGLNDIDIEWQNFINPRPQNTPQHLPSTSDVDSSRNTRSLQSVEDWDIHDDDMFTPFPSNLPVNEMIHHISDVERWTLVAERAYSDCTPVDMLHGKAYWSELKEVYVILFGVGEKDTEGIYSLRALSDDGLPRETIIAFESEDDAERYSGLLEATMEHVPHVCSIPPEELTQFCKDAGYSCRLEQQGSTLTPPNYNVGITDWERSMRLREGCWSVLEEEPTSYDHPSYRSYWPLYAADHSLSGLRPMPASTVRQMLDSSQQQLAAIRARLESLLD